MENSWYWLDRWSPAGNSERRYIVWQRMPMMAHPKMTLSILYSKLICAIISLRIYNTMDSNLKYIFRKAQNTWTMLTIRHKLQATIIGLGPLTQMLNLGGEMVQNTPDSPWLTCGRASRCTSSGGTRRSTAPHLPVDQPRQEIMSVKILLIANLLYWDWDCQDWDWAGNQLQVYD